MRTPLSSYIPESFFFSGKQQIPSRLCRESLALLRASDDYRILACRGTALCEGASFLCLCEIQNDERSFLEASIGTHRTVAIAGKRGPILLFGDLLAHTGLLLAVCPSLPSESLRRALLALGRHDVLCSPAIPNEAMIPHAADAETADRLRELFFYLDRILKPRDAISFWTQTRLTSGIVGREVEPNRLPIKEIEISEAEQARLSAFLLSVFLRYRHEDGKASAHVSEDDAYVSYRVELLSVKKHLPDTDGARDGTSALPVFQPFAASGEIGRAHV